MKTLFTYKNVNTSSIRFALNAAKSALNKHSDGINVIANDITEEEWKGSSKVAFLGVFPKFSAKSKNVCSRLDKLDNILKKIDDVKRSYDILNSLINTQNSVTEESAKQLQLTVEEAKSLYQQAIDAQDRITSGAEEKIKGMSV